MDYIWTKPTRRKKVGATGSEGYFEKLYHEGEKELKDVRDAYDKLKKYVAELESNNKKALEFVDSCGSANAYVRFELHRLLGEDYQSQDTEDIEEIL